MHGEFRESELIEIFRKLHEEIVRANGEHTLEWIKRALINARASVDVKIQKL